MWIRIPAGQNRHAETSVNGSCEGDFSATNAKLYNIKRGAGVVPQATTRPDVPGALLDLLDFLEV